VIIDGLNGGLKGKLREATKLVYGGLMWVYLTWIRGGLMVGVARG
jgi:hypothetical protein